jgi:hypothetical protein
MLDRILHAPINLFYDVTPVSRVIGYFTGDIRALDAHLFWMIPDMLMNNLKVLQIVGTTIMGVPFLIIP